MCGNAGKKTLEDALSESNSHQSTRLRASTRLTALIACEAGNRHDPKAVRVEIAGQHVGYLSREEARGFRIRYGGNSVECAAKIIGGWNAIDGGSFGVRLDLRL